jgi:hypothetical protein
MTKFSVTKNGKVLDPSLYIWDENTKTFSSKEKVLVLDFTDIYGVTFNTGRYCTFNTGTCCTFNTDHDCTFKTGTYCTFNTGSDCTFNTGSFCTFNTGYSCTFKTGHYCTFNTGSDCTFNTGSDCTFKAGIACTFNTGSDCTFITNYECTFEVGYNCFVRRSDVKGVKGVTEIPTGKKIKLNDYEIAGYTVIEEKKEASSCNGKVVEIDSKKYKLTEVKE